MVDHTDYETSETATFMARTDTGEMEIGAYSWNQGNLILINGGTN